MTEAVFQAPKRRKRVYESYEGALPVVGSAGEEPQTLRAEMLNQQVVVREPQHIQALYGKGYFGKGILSRSRPQHSISEKWKSVNGRSLPVISFSKYQQHVKWAQDVLLSQGLDDDVVTEMLEKLTHPTCLDQRDEGEEVMACEENVHSPGWRREPRDPPLDPATSAPESCDNRSDPIEPLDAEDGSPMRQGNPRYDPLAELHAPELERPALTGIRCDRHDDWLVHCGCRPHDSLPYSASRPSPTPSSGYEYVLVEEEEEEENAGAELSSHPSALRLVCRVNPFRIMEYLQLSLEEAFFLVYALGCLSIYDNEAPLSITCLWQTFCLLQPSFRSTYTAYHYFRSKGWVPKVGVKYGANLLLYRKGPPFYHASYSVVVEKVDDSFQGATLRPFTWRTLAALSRITGNVSKEVMLCYVIVPSDMTVEELSSPECIKRMQVQEIIVSRWVSSRERADQEEI